MKGGMLVRQNMKPPGLDELICHLGEKMRCGLPRT